MGCQKIRRTGSVRHQDLIMQRVCIVVVLLYMLTTVNLITVIMNGILSVYLLQENKSYGSENHLLSSSDVQEVVSSTI